MQKGCVYVIMLKIALKLVKNVFFGLKKSISELLHWIAQKHIAPAYIEIQLPWFLRDGSVY